MDIIFGYFLKVDLLVEYKTVLNSATAEFEEKKSKFIANVRPVNNEEEATGFIHEIKTKYWNATHNVYAYSINKESLIQRYSDDGEPSGTAGMPVLEVMKRMGIQDAVVVVTRYFGGTLLGAAGLIRAYSKSAALGIESAEVVTRKLCTAVHIVIEYTLFGKLQNMLINNEIIIQEIKYEQDVEVNVMIENGAEDSFVKQVVELTNDRALIDIGDKRYVTLTQEGAIVFAE